MSLEVGNVFSGYGTMTILHGVSVRVQQGKTVAVIGPNGAGKSTLLKTIFGYLKPRSGVIYFDGENITSLRPDIILRKGITYLPQGRSIFRYMTVLENLKLGAYTINNRSEIEKRVAEVFSRFPVLKKRKNQLAGSLSGGEQRMLELGRALLLHPKLMLLDEPSLGLAPILLYETYDTIEEIKNEGMSLLIVEQNVRKVLTVADYIYALNLGQNAFAGTRELLLDSNDLKKLYLGGF